MTPRTKLQALFNKVLDFSGIPVIIVAFIGSLAHRESYVLRTEKDTRVKQAKREGVSGSRDQ